MPEAKKPTLSFEFVLLDCLDKRGEPRTSGVTRSRIQAHVGRKHRAERAQKQEQVVRRTYLSAANMLMGSQLDPFKTLPSISIERTHPGCLDSLKRYTFMCYPQPQVKSILLPAALKSPCLFAAILLIAASSMNGSRNTTVDPELLSLRQETLSLVRRQLLSPELSGTAEHIVAIQFLGGASFAYGFEPDQNFMTHLQAVSTLIRKRGHSEFKKTSIGQVVLNTLVVANYTNRACLGLPLDPHISIDLMTPRTSRQSLRIAAWVSPLFWPDSDTLLLDKFRSICDDNHEKLWQLIANARELVELVFSETWETSYLKFNSTAATLASLVNGFPNGRGEEYAHLRAYQIHRYECCRLTTILMTRVLSRSQGWSDAADGTSFADDLVFSLSNSDLSELWGNQVGLLHWVVLVAYAVLHKTKHRLFVGGLMHRIMSEISYGDQDPGIGIRSVGTLAEFEEECRRAGMEDPLLLLEER